ncbi:lipopolysaccharide biosynthesis protein [Leekyejoonella antrihumi]|uniref:Polysaccharide biosynthesis protein n=1 Tax=Leekyejoonella antrihumi TaxID=1660198 RepID=A0A563E3M5_9MICO|nr:oligosaccharide flippase family protein [Leekyejoonella antrihumi]TWP37126.1 hypothetical protein FGL98_06815 [Leekyejoonella antrihumi]
MSAPKPASDTAAPSTALGLLLGVAMGSANVLGYVMVLLLSRSLGPSDFGGYSALSTYGVMLAIPAGAFQVVIARRLSGRTGDTLDPTNGLRLALTAGLGLFALTCAVSPALAHTFHLPSAWAAVLLGGMLVPMLLTGCFQGVLLGGHRIRALSVLYVMTALTRLIAAAISAGLGWGVTQVFAAMLTAATATMLTGAWLCRAQIRRLPFTGHGLARELVRSNSTLAAYIVLTNVDVLLARHFLSTHDSGGYALASTFGRAICWGTQFIALMIVPRMHSKDAARTLLKASGLVVAIGVTGFAVVATSPSLWITIAGGVEFKGFGQLALACVGLGIAWALAQVWLFSEMGSNQGLLGALTWVVIVLEVLAITLFWHNNAGQIVAVCSTGAVLIALVGLVRVILRHQARVDLGEDSAFIVADSPRT